MVDANKIELLVMQQNILLIQVNEAIDTIIAHESAEEAWDMYALMLKHGLIPHAEYSSSDPMSHLLPNGIGDSPYDDFYMERGSSRCWLKIARDIEEKIEDGDESILSMLEWKRAVMQTRTTQFNYDW